MDRDESTRRLNTAQQAAETQFARRSHRYGRGHILANVDDVEAAERLLRLPAPADVLDVAAGAGHTGLHFAAEGHRVVISDLTEEMLRLASSLAEERQLSAVFRRHSAEELPYADDSFDLVTCRVAGHHFSDPERFVRESARVLRPGGYLIVIDGTVDEAYPEAAEWLHRLEALRDPSHGRFWSPKAWATWSERHGFQILSCETHPFKQPDLEWYLETAGTRDEHRQQIRQMVAEAPAEARRLFALSEEGGKIVWWWQRLTLVAQHRPPAANGGVRRSGTNDDST